MCFSVRSRRLRKVRVGRLVSLVAAIVPGSVWSSIVMVIVFEDGRKPLFILPKESKAS